MNLINNTSDISEKINHYHTLSRDLSQLEDSYTYALKAYELSTEHNLLFDRIRSLWYLGNSKIYQKEFESSVEFISEGLNLISESYESLDSDMLYWKGKLLELKGWSQASDKNFYEALQSYNEAIMIFTELDKPIGFITSSIGHLLTNAGDFELASEYFIKAADINMLNNKYDFAVLDFVGLAAIYDNQSEHEKSIENLYKALEIDTEKGQSQYNNYIKLNLGISNFKLKNYDKALKFLVEARGHYLLSTNNRDNIAVATCEVYLGKINFSQENKEKLLSIFMAAKKTAEQFEDIDLKMLSLEAIAKANTQLGNYKEALKTTVLFNELKDSIFNDKLLLSLRSVDLKNRYETIQKEKDNSFRQEILNTKLKHQWYLIFILLLFILSACTAAYFLFKSNLKNKEMKDEVLIKNQSLHSTKSLLEESNRDMKKYIKINKELEQFAYIASHDIKGPLRTISSFSSLIKKEFYNVAKQKERSYFEFIENGTRSLNLLIDDLLEYSKSNTKAVKIERLNLVDVINEVILLLDFSITTKNARIEKSNCNMVVYADQVKLKQILQNIISNALKFSDKERPPHILISAEETKDFIFIHIKDNGIGIEEKYFDQVFEKFARLNSKEQFEGTGLGLSICAKYVEDHDGVIEINKNEEYGVTVSFSISKYLNSNEI